VLVITINRPEAKNALNGAVGRGVADAVDQLDASEDLRVGVLTGAGGVFSAGQTPPRKPLVGAVEGWASAGGFELLLACDLVVAARTAQLGVPEVKRSLVPGVGAALLLTRRVPFAIAMELLLTGEVISAERAAQIGLVNRLTDYGGALDTAVELATTIATNGTLAVAATKQIARSSADWSEAQGWEQQAAIMQPVFASEDAREGATAFAQKRSPPSATDLLAAGACGVSCRLVISHAIPRRQSVVGVRPGRFSRREDPRAAR